MTKHRWPGLEVHEVFAVVGVETLFSVAATMDSRLPGFQELDLWSRRTCQDMTGGGRLVFSFGTVDLAVSKERQGLIKHCHQHCYGELEDPSFCPDPQCRLTTLHPKWTTVLAIFQNAFPFLHFCCSYSLPWKCTSVVLHPADLCHFIKLRCSLTL